MTPWLATAAPSLAPPADLASVLVVLAVLAILPFVLAVVTSFAKLIVVGGIIRHAIGTPRIPPTVVLTGLAIVLTIHVMAPVGIAIHRDYQSSARIARAASGGRAPQVLERWTLLRDGLQPGNGALSPDQVKAIRNISSVDDLLAGTDAPARRARQMLADDAPVQQLAARPATVPGRPQGATVSTPAAGINLAVLRTSVEGPLDEFLVRHSAARNIQLFERLSARLLRAQNLEESALTGSLRSFVIHAPAFMLTELTEAFMIGVLIFVPFLIIDLVVSNILLAMGMPMLSPTMISLPMKLLVFVMMDGWGLIVRGLVSGYI